MELYLHSLTRLHGMMVIQMLVVTKFHGVTSQKAAVTVLGPTSLLRLHLCVAEFAELFDLGFTFMSVYIYTYQCELVLSAKLQLQCILVNT